MAAPDFPASPTVGQTYTAPSGLVYTWDGQVWNTSGGVASTYWTDTGTALTPTTATRSVSALAPSGDCVVFGSRTVKGRLTAPSSGDAANLSVNRNTAGTFDDAAQSSWRLLLRPTSAGDSMIVWRAPAGGAEAALLTLDNAGHIQSKAMGCQMSCPGNQSIPASTTTSITLTASVDSSGGVMSTPPTAKSPAYYSYMNVSGYAQFSVAVSGTISVAGLTGWWQYNSAVGLMMFSYNQYIAANSTLTLQCNITPTATVVGVMFTALAIATG